MSSPQSTLEPVDPDEVIDLGGPKAELADMLQQLGELIRLARIYAPRVEGHRLLTEVIDDCMQLLRQTQQHVRDNIPDDV
jgi:hypothetical protein